MFSALKSLFKISLNKISPNVAKWLEDTLYNVAQWFLTSFQKYFNKLFPWLVGGSGVALSGFSISKVFNKAEGQFNFLSSLLHIDKLFNTINDSFLADAKLSSFCSSSFNEIMGAFGVISCINTIINTLGVLIIWALVFYIVRIFAGIALSLVSVAVTKF